MAKSGLSVFLVNFFLAFITVAFGGVFYTRFKSIQKKYKAEKRLANEAFTKDEIKAMLNIQTQPAFPNFKSTESYLDVTEIEPSMMEPINQLTPTCDTANITGTTTEANQ